LQYAGDIKITLLNFLPSRSLALRFAAINRVDGQIMELGLEAQDIVLA
jgi:hypothetical protein